MDKMGDFIDYPLPRGVHVIPKDLLDTRPDSEIDAAITHPPPPVTSEKNVWFFWHTGYATMHPYTQRNVRAWHRRLSKQGWVIRVLDRVPGSACNVSAYLPTTPALFPRAFIEGTLSGRYAVQHVSDLIRFPVLLRHGGVYADVGLLQIGDLDRLWATTIANPSSPYEVLSYNQKGGLTNYFLASRPANPFFARCHRLLLALWDEHGGKTSTEGMSASALLRGVPLMGGALTIEEEDGTVIPPDEVSRMLSDYIIQGQAITMVMGLVDDEDGWDGPRYVAEHVYGIEWMVGAQLINEYTNWDGKRAFELMSLPLPRDGEVETADQTQAREIVEACLSRSFQFKLAHGFIIRVFKFTLGSLWRAHEGSDNVLGTYAHWLRYGTIYWNQDDIPPPLEFPVKEPIKRGPLLREK
ncbi:hypothetical protein F5B19DRAFT_496123 [Rostrohypoxylon terebratum]|nr:hypothetical protein F5B19DRAFT_496123 [Rostrohypoxylon terebratum]